MFGRIATGMYKIRKYRRFFSPDYLIIEYTIDTVPARSLFRVPKLGLNFDQATIREDYLTLIEMAVRIF